LGDAIDLWRIVRAGLARLEEAEIETEVLASD
jgi:hypothetical protein